MAIVKCRECGKEVSSEAKNCPHCGIKNPAPQSTFRKVVYLGIGALVLVQVFSCISRSNESTQRREAAEAAKTPEQKAADAKREAEFQSVVIVLKTLKASAKNPKSFELVDAFLTDEGTVCATYRATNSFNALVTEKKAVALNPVKEVPWNKGCAGKRGRDMSYARHAL